MGLILYGAGIEIAQYALTETRVGDTHDLLADILAVLLGSCLYLSIVIITQRIKAD